METQQREVHLEAIANDGFTVLRNAVDLAFVDAIRKRVRELEAETLAELAPGQSESDSSFLRTGGLLRLDSLFWEVPIYPVVTDIVEGVLGADFLLSTFSAIDLKPKMGNLQPLHPDDALIPVSRPHERPIGCTCMWVITPFNQDTGGTRLLPGSHRAPLDLLFSQDPELLAQVVQPEMAPGDILVFDHALFHGAADNSGDDWRLGLQVSYHAGWIRPYTNWFRSVPIEEAATYPEKLTDLMGYKTYQGIGSQTVVPGTYRESYTGNRTPRPPRIPLS